MREITRFDEDTIYTLFGNEAGENENPERLREYYFKTNMYDRIKADLPLRILVGHKGVGKSALFTFGRLEDGDANVLNILIQPDDVSQIAVDCSDFLQTIREWKTGISRIITNKSLDQIGLAKKPGKKQGAGQLINTLCDFFNPIIQDKINIEPAKKLVTEHFLNSKKLNVYIDDLDRGWQGSKSDVTRIAALLAALRDLGTENPGIHFKAALRSDVYFLVRTSDESTDKIESSVIWCSWTNHEILAMLVKRIVSHQYQQVIPDKELLRAKQGDLAHRIEKVIDYNFRGDGKWSNVPTYKVLLSMIRKRPRDIVKLCILAARKAGEQNSKIISTEDFRSIFEDYSQSRLQDTVNEYRTELPNIESLLVNMKPNHQERKNQSGFLYSTENLLQKIRNIKESHNFSFSTGKKSDEKELASFLYKINFLIARKDMRNKIVRKYFEEQRYLSSSFSDFGFMWEVHPAYRWALQPDDIQSIFNKLDVETDDD